LQRSLSLLGLDRRLSVVEFHLFHRRHKIVVRDIKIESLQGFLLVPVPQDGVGNVRINPSAHGIRDPTVPEVVDREFEIETSGQGVYDTQRSDDAMSERTFTAVIHKEEDLFIAECPEVGTVSQGYTLEEAVANLREATELYLEEFPSPPASRVIMTTFEATYG
jgi:predicted RNase H-like HicB family nuclease